MKPIISTTYHLYKYLCPEKLILSAYIREYDLSAANINALLYTNAIDNKLYSSLSMMNKYDREKYVGLMELENIMYHNKIQEGIIAAKKMLFEANNIEDHNILAINNDAVFTINKECLITSFLNEQFVFKLKNVYTMFFKIKDLEFYYAYNIQTKNHKIDVKGINDEILPRNFEFLGFLCEIFYMLQNCPIEDTVNVFSTFYDDFINRRCDLEMYREFNSESKFRIKSEFSPYTLDWVSPDMINLLDINRNLSILLELHSVISSIYFNKNKK